ncbi:MAG: TetR/AcrR family transcriptional regulator [Actinoplanes sp.]
MTAQPAARRADARRNREHLVATAAEVFASGQKTISLDAIAKRAGIGSATLYRHFPTREDLVEEVYRDQIRPLREAATALLTDGPTANALLTWMKYFAAWASERRGISEALVAMSSTGRFGTGPVCDEVQQILALLLEAGSQAGELRSDLDPTDVAGLLVGAISATGAAGQPPRLEKMLSILMDGLRRR